MAIRDTHTVDYLTETTANLGISAAFDGTSWDMTPTPAPFELFQATFVSSHASATDGAKIQASSDGSTWTDVATGTQAANVPLTLSIMPCARYMRARQVNGATAQTSNAVFVAVRKAVV